MRLKSDLKMTWEKFVAAADPAAVETMLQATNDLITTGIANQIVGVDKRAPQFTLEDERGVGFALSDFLSRGPVILHFFRGFW